MPQQSNAFTMGLNAAVMKHGAGRKVDVEVHDEAVTTGYRCGLAQDAKDAGDL